MSRSDLGVISLYTGCGGLDLGLERAGFSVDLCVEIDTDARDTLRKNRPKWLLAEPGDVHSLTPRQVLAQAGSRKGKPLILSGGPPCQPFSKSGFWVNGDTGRLRDPRASTLRAYVDVLDAALPQVLLLENVQGMIFAGKDEGLQLLRRSLRRINRKRGTRYEPQVLRINSADYGVPQLRDRVFIVADRDGRELTLPGATHADVRDQPNPFPKIEPLRTAWDAIGDLDGDDWPDELTASGKWADLLPTIPEGENYLWHTPRSGGMPLFGWRTRFWSFLLKLAKDRPAWTIQAAPGPATGPFHWRKPPTLDSRVVPPPNVPGRLPNLRQLLSCASAGRKRGPQPLSVSCSDSRFADSFSASAYGRSLRLVPAERPGCPHPERVRRVPRKYHSLGRDHQDHPGTGNGPAARSR